MNLEEVAGKTTTTITSTGLDEENATTKDCKATYLHEDSYAASSKMNGWVHLKHTFLSRSKASASVLVSHTMAISMLIATNERPVFHYTDAFGCKGPLSRAERTRVRHAIVRGSVTHMASSAVLAGGGNSDDSVRVAFDILTVFARNAGEANRFDHVRSWRKEPVERMLDVDSGWP